jgi:hypothetical protein
MRQENMTVEYVTHMPEKLSEGVVYISHEYSLAIHLCCCGCGNEAVMPLGEKGWILTEGETVSFEPSILNRFCKSHYFIRKNKVEWA